MESSVLKTKMIAATGAAAAVIMLGAAAPASGAPAAKGVTELRQLYTLYSVACPTSKACVAVGVNQAYSAGKSVTINAASGKVKVSSGSVKNFYAETTACPDKTTCLSVADNEVVSVKVSTGKMRVTAKPKAPKGDTYELKSIACAGSKVCYAVGWRDSTGGSKAVLAVLSPPGKLLAQSVSRSVTSYTAVGCSSATTCFVTEQTGSFERVVPLVHGKFATAHKLPAGLYTVAISCHGTKLCYALGFTSTHDELVQLNPTSGRPGKIINLTPFSSDSAGIDCYSATQCILAGTSSSATATLVPTTVVVTKGKLGKYKLNSSLTGQFISVGCATAKLCYAAGAVDTTTTEYGVVVKI
jgi:hypothetical protein